MLQLTEKDGSVHKYECDHWNDCGGKGWMEDHADGVVKGVILVQPHVRYLGLVSPGLFVLWSQRQV